MTDRGVLEAAVKPAALTWLESPGRSIRNGAEIQPCEQVAESFNGRRV